MASDNIGQLNTFCQLLEEEKSIIIPKVQRDYAYGRQEKKVQDVLDGMLASIIEAVKDDSSNILDFVYGVSYVHKSGKKAGLIPLDGQQRLTTLFLLHFYASLLGTEEGKLIDQNEVEILTKFRYETRQSATEFCTNLIRNIRPNLIKNYKPENKNIKALIVDDALYLSTYDSDPTIISMLNVLDKIEKKCAELDVLSLMPCMWKRLMERRNIEFYKLSLDNFGLTDDLFIKMNARGKKLTAFEIFKSDMIAAIRKVDDSLKDEFSKDLDTKWIDIVWDYTDKTIDDKRQPLDITNDADTAYSMLFHNIFRVEYYRRNLGPEGFDEQDINAILKDKEGITRVKDMFDTLYSIHKNMGFKKLWDTYFYFSEDVVGDEGNIRLFWKQKQKQISVFELAMQGELTVPEVIYLYSMYLLYKNGAKEDSMKRCLRIIRNLITANVRAADARTEKLSSFLVEAKYVIDKNGIDTSYDKDAGLLIDCKVHKLAFVQNAWNEEFAKQNYLCPDSYEKLLKYENHQILQCSLSLFMDHCLETDGLEDMKSIELLNTTKLIELLNKFEKIYSNNYLDYFQKIRVALLDKDIDYMQYDAYMDRNDNSIRRYFITKPSEQSAFYIKHAQRRKQENILKILEKMPLPDALLNPSDSCKRFDIKNWKYYIAKYPEQSTHQWTRYGIGVWDDFSKYPLDLIILNSSQHSEGNLEWMMMTFLLKNILNNDEKYHLDVHGCHPISIKKTASAIQFKQGKWLIECSNNLIQGIKEQLSNFSIEEIGDNKISIDFGSEDCDLDYIELGLKLVRLLENP